MGKDEIWDLYMLSKSEVENSVYYSSFYLFLLKKSKKFIINKPDRLKKFALLSLFQEYRNCKDSGFSSELARFYSFPIKDRIEGLEIILGKKIKNIFHYTELIGWDFYTKNKLFMILSIPLAFIPLSIRFYFMIIFSGKFSKE